MRRGIVVLDSSPFFCISFLFLLVLFLTTFRPLIPTALTAAGFIMGRNGLDVLHGAFDGGASLAPVTVHYREDEPMHL